MAIVFQEYKQAKIKGTCYVGSGANPEAYAEWQDVKTNIRTFKNISPDAVLHDLPTPGFKEHLKSILDVAQKLTSHWPKVSSLDIEWIIDDDGLHFVQARPLPLDSFLSIKNTAVKHYPEVDQTKTWRRDVHHNPSPVSEAQASLIALADAVSPTALCTVDGYLYEARLNVPKSVTANDKPPSIADTSKAVEDKLDAIDKSNSLEERLSQYQGFLRLYFNDWYAILKKEDQPIKTAHPFQSALAQCKKGLISFDELSKRIGFASQGWDVALPTFDEDKSTLRRAVEATIPSTGHKASSINHWEQDDLWFYKAQAIIRKALLELGEAFFPSEPELIFHLSIEKSMAIQKETLSLTEGKATALKNKDLHQKRKELDMPAIIHNGMGTSDVFRKDRTLSGIGIGNNVEGVVLKCDVLPTLIPPNTIWVTQSATPASLVLAPSLKGIVSETGGVLSHVAAMARELSISAVVGCQGAWQRLQSGDKVRLICDAGVCLKIG